MPAPLEVGERDVGLNSDGGIDSLGLISGLHYGRICLVSSSDTLDQEESLKR